MKRKRRLSLAGADALRDQRVAAMRQDKRALRVAFLETQMPARFKKVVEWAQARGLSVRPVVLYEKKHYPTAVSQKELWIGDKRCGFHICTRAWRPNPRQPQRYGHTVLNHRLLGIQQALIFELRISGYPIRMFPLPSEIVRSDLFGNDCVEGSKAFNIPLERRVNRGHYHGFDVRDWEDRWEDVFGIPPAVP